MIMLPFKLLHQSHMRFDQLSRSLMPARFRLILTEFEQQHREAGEPYQTPIANLPGSIGRTDAKLQLGLHEANPGKGLFCGIRKGLLVETNTCVKEASQRQRLIVKAAVGEYFVWCCQQ
ncbi:hypothetical protein KW445_21130 [Vibrio fluvialis]|nr:hypothetical protein [Vibrio fluvialis]